MCISVGSVRGKGLRFSARSQGREGGRARRDRGTEGQSAEGGKEIEREKRRGASAAFPWELSVCLNSLFLSLCLLVSLLLLLLLLLLFLLLLLLLLLLHTSSTSSSPSFAPTSEIASEVG